MRYTVASLRFHISPGSERDSISHTKIVICCKIISIDQSISETLAYVVHIVTVEVVIVVIVIVVVIVVVAVNHVDDVQDSADGDGGECHEQERGYRGRGRGGWRAV